jgi:diguanylate cyclase
MDYKSVNDEAYKYLRLALPHMSEHGIPIIPKKYSVWYKYVSGTDRELTQAIDAMLEKGEAFSEEINEKLYWHFCSEKDENQLKDIRDDLQQILVTILGEVTQLTGQTQKYESFMADSVKILSENPSPGEVKDIVKTIIDETVALTLEK